MYSGIKREIRVLIRKIKYTSGDVYSIPKDADIHQLEELKLKLMNIIDSWE